MCFLIIIANCQFANHLHEVKQLGSEKKFFFSVSLRDLPARLVRRACLRGEKITTEARPSGFIRAGTECTEKHRDPQGSSI
jgi:hypothetical protein